MQVLGIDIGGSGIKGALVDVETGEMKTDRHRINTPNPSTPAAVAQVVTELVRTFDWNGHVGVTFPAIVRHGVVYSAANVDKSWIGTDADALFGKATGLPTHVLNDADAAGMAEMKFGAGKGRKGVVILLTFGTGIGSAIFVEGNLLPNTEFGHLPIRGKIAEHRASARIRDEENLSWKEWAERVNEYLQVLDFFFSPDLFIVGGGISKKFDKFMPYLQSRVEIVPARMMNDAGIVGAAVAAKDAVLRVPAPTT